MRRRLHRVPNLERIVHPAPPQNLILHLKNKTPLQFIIHTIH